VERNGQYLQVANHLEAMIASGVIAPGAKVPSLRKLGEQFSLSVGTVRRSVDFLREKGILTIRPGSGAYVSERRNSSFAASHTSSAKYRIAVFVTTDDLSNCYCAHALQGIQSAVGKNCSLILHFHDYCRDYHNDNTIDLPLLEEAAAESDALLFLGCYDYILKKLPLTKPCVGVEMHSSYNGLMSTIALDPLNAAEQACDFFQKRGYKKVKILSEAAEPMPVYRFRRMAFADLWRNFGELEDVCDAKLIKVEHVSDKDTAYFFTSDTEYNRLACAYKEKYGKALVDERCILSVDGKSLLIPGYEPINTIAVDWKIMGVMALEECIRRIENPGTQSRRIYQNCYLKENQN
jgi:DNA-binding transcriptional regulator YhcF (GntR family)